MTARPPVPHRLSSTVLALLVPLAVLLVAGLAIASFADELPDRVATHWDSTGPNGTGTLAGFLAVALGVPAVVAVGCWLLAVLAGRSSGTRRISVGFAVGFAIAFAVMAVGALAVQRGIEDGLDAPGIDGVVVAGILAGVVLGVAVALLAPRDAPQPTAERVPADAPRLDLAPGARAAWTRTVSSRSTAVVVGVVCVVLVLLAVVLHTPLTLVVAVVLAAMLGTMFVFHVSVDERGLTVRSALGWPRLVIPLDEVEQARVVHVRPVPEFGGWGYRLGRGGRTGIVLRTGPGVEVERTGGRTYVVTVDDAERAVALLNTLADRHRVG
ncbi:DUF1648 domain-containing protein [Cellulomonas alba]|uniref:DUF1648 domain-containing protein n=1 Tax=Cellulomonas alba TaxID=3053467 RepID=A0ABT7SIF6_9CELL|nr:DUF1648 domain-containing protein [Cellulomonas alba]MDM7855971.1 DUF1648 domain-containing protein [Cellulomonas alba]